MLTILVVHSFRFVIIPYNATQYSRAVIALIMGTKQFSHASSLNLSTN